MNNAISVITRLCKVSTEYLSFFLLESIFGQRLGYALATNFPQSPQKPAAVYRSHPYPL